MAIVLQSCPSILVVLHVIEFEEVQAEMRVNIRVKYPENRVRRVAPDLQA